MNIPITFFKVLLKKFESYYCSERNMNVINITINIKNIRKSMYLTTNL